MSNTAVTNHQGTLWDSWATKNGDYVKYYAKGPCGKKGRCLGIASGCRTDQPYIDPMGSQLERETFDIPVYCTTCGYVGNFQVHKLDMDQVNANTDTPARPVRGSPTAVNQDYLDALDLFNNKEDQASTLELVRSRTEKWAATTTALTSLFGIGSILISVASLPDIDKGWRIGIALLLLLGLVCLVGSMHLQIPRSPVIPKVDNLRTFKKNLQTERTKRALEELDDLGRSTFATFLGLGLFCSALALSRFAPKMDDESEF